MPDPLPAVPPTTSPPTDVLSDPAAYAWIVAGIALSVVVPVAIKTLRPPGPTADGIGAAGSSLARWFADVLRPYLAYAAASLVLGLITFAGYKMNGGSFKGWEHALMAGYLWDATLQKIREGFRA